VLFRSEHTMLTYRVDDMTCGHCAATITKAVQAIDAGAKVQVDLARHLVRIDAARSMAAAVRDAIAEAGYSPVEVTGPAVTAAPAAARGCCCG